MTSLSVDNPIPEARVEAPVLVGVMAEFPDVDSIFAAAERVRDAGFKNWDVYSPFPIHGIDAAMGIKPTILPFLVLAGGLTGLISGIILQWWTNAYDYPFLVSGKPLFSLPANIPIIFELTILCGSLTAFFGMFLLNQLPMLYNPLFKSERFRRATNDRFFIVIEAADPQFQETATGELLRSLGATAVERVED
jgi:hypothetical protein